MRRPLALGAAATAAVLLLAGCGSSSSTSSTSSAASAPSTAAQSTPAPTTTSASAGGVMVSSKHGKLGTILAAGPKKLTVYLFEADKGATSTCAGECAKDWPPVTTSGDPQAGGGAIAADLGTITRPEGIKQVTYKGHPLYFFEKDKDDGDSYGQAANAFGADWYAMKTSGVKVDSDEDSAKGGEEKS